MPGGCDRIRVVGTGKTLSVGEWDIALSGASTPYKNWKFICSFYETKLNLCPAIHQASAPGYLMKQGSLRRASGNRDQWWLVGWMVPFNYRIYSY